jgi:hypothetical protein
VFESFSVESLESELIESRQFDPGLPRFGHDGVPPSVDFNPHFRKLVQVSQTCGSDALPGVVEGSSGAVLAAICNDKCQDLKDDEIECEAVDQRRMNFWIVDTR